MSGLVDTREREREREKMEIVVRKVKKQMRFCFVGGP